MKAIIWSPKKGGTRIRRFKSVRKAKDFIPEACRQDFGGFAYFYDVRGVNHGTAEQWRYGNLTWRNRV